MSRQNFLNESPQVSERSNLSFRYTRYFNKKHERQGALFHGRYKAILIEPEAYLNDLVRYITTVLSGMDRLNRLPRANGPATPPMPVQMVSLIGLSRRRC